MFDTCLILGNMFGRCPVLGHLSNMCPSVSHVRYKGYTLRDMYYYSVIILPIKRAIRTYYLHCSWSSFLVSKLLNTVKISHMLINPSNKMEPGKQRKQQNRYADLKHFNCWNVPFQPSRIVLCIHESGKPTFCCMDTNYRASFPFADIFNELKLKKHYRCMFSQNIKWSVRYCTE